MKALFKRKLGIVFLIFQLLVSIGLIVIAVHVNLFAAKYLIMLIAVIVFFLAYMIFSQISDKSYIVGRILCVLICGFYAFGGYYCMYTYSAIDDMAGQDVKVDQISCIVLKDDPAQSIYDTKDYTYGILKTNDRANTDKSLAQVKAAIGTDPKIAEYEDNDILIDSLFAKEVQVIIINEANRNLIEEYYPKFSDDTRVLDTHNVETVIEKEEVVSDLTEEPFNLYLSGIDLYGDIKQTSRSDVNVIMTVNPKTKKILLTSTPRDFYVPLEGVSGGMSDKLTHAGIHGVDCSIKTLEKLYDIDIDYYIRVNFTSLRKIVNLLGGVDVYSDFTFTSDWGPSFKKGYNHVNGVQALAFCRERHHFQNGDYQRGRDHQHMIEAILNKIMSPKVLPKYQKLLKTASANFQTNIPTKDILGFAKMQLDEMPQWKIKYANADGSGAMKTTYSYQSRPLYVCVPDQASVDKISKRIKKFMKEDENSVDSDDDNSSTETQNKLPE